MPNEIPASLAATLPQQGGDACNFFPVTVDEDTVNLVVDAESRQIAVAVMCSTEEGWGVCMTPDAARKLAKQLIYVAELAESGVLSTGGDA